MHALRRRFLRTLAIGGVVAGAGAGGLRPTRAAAPAASRRRAQVDGGLTRRPRTSLKMCAALHRLSARHGPRTANLVAAAMLSVATALADDPVARWSFEGADSLGTWQGKPQLTSAGPRAPRYPGFDRENHAAAFSGGPLALIATPTNVRDTANLTFTAGDAITLETWVRVKAIGEGDAVYVMAKETGGAGALNYALRLRGTEDGVQVGFEFSAPSAPGKPPTSHRWWSLEGFEWPASWHHIAFSYTFGDRTLIVVATEFGRPWDFDGGSGRGHQGSVFTMVLAGGGLRHRGAYGTSDDKSARVVEHPVSIPDFHATIHAALGINPAKELVNSGRPVPITDGGKPIAALFG